MSLSKFSAVAVLALMLCATTQGALIIDVGNHQLLPETPDQIIDLYVYGGASISGVTLNVQFANGASGPRITDADLLAGSMFDAGNTGNGWNWGPDDHAISIGTVLLSGSVPAGGATEAEKTLLARLTISTEGITSGGYDLIVSETLDGKTRFADASSQPLYPVVYDGSVSIAAIPEPASLTLLGAGGLALLRRRR